MNQVITHTVYTNNVLNRSAQSVWVRRRRTTCPKQYAFF